MPRPKSTTDDEAADENNHGGWTTIATPNTLINLLDLGSGRTMNLGATTLPTGNYRSFRLVLDTDQSTITLKDGSEPPIHFPSAGQSGIKVKLDEPIQLTEDGSVMTLDFDIGRSFVMRGNSSANGFNFKPVIHAVAQDVTGSVTGSVRANSATGAAVPDATVEVLTAGSLADRCRPDAHCPQHQHGCEREFQNRVPASRYLRPSGDASDSVRIQGGSARGRIDDHGADRDAEPDHRRRALVKKRYSSKKNVTAPGESPRSNFLGLLHRICVIVPRRQSAV